MEVTKLSSQRSEECFVPDEMFLLFDVTGDAHVEGNSQVLLIDICLFYFNVCTVHLGARGGIVVKALRYKPAGRGFDSRWCHWKFSVT